MCSVTQLIHQSIAGVLTENNALKPVYSHLQSDEFRMAAPPPHYSSFPMRTMEVTTCCPELHRITRHRLSSAVDRRVLTSGDLHQLRAQKCEKCSLCLDWYRVGDAARRLPACKHVFHEDCLWEVIKKGYPCPTCRTPVHPDLICEKTHGRHCYNRPMNPDFVQTWLNHNAEITIYGSPKERAWLLWQVVPKPPRTWEYAGRKWYSLYQDEEHCMWEGEYLDMGATTRDRFHVNISRKNSTDELRDFIVLV